ncbi:hypothetical protein GA0115246_113786 [Streptomyces sp. SolWspMP-sol7th]|nr:hypothetical protein GA0115246_113786 [Streptomyces sp. SolWspMP-sol7th]
MPVWRGAGWGVVRRAGRDGVRVVGRWVRAWWWPVRRASWAAAVRRRVRVGVSAGSARASSSTVAVPGVVCARKVR